jgi:hypothetical protein
MTATKEAGPPAQNPISGDAGPGTTMEDLLPAPAVTQPVDNPQKEETSPTLTEGTSLSHSLATTEHVEKGLAQQDHGDEVLDLGWNQEKQEVFQPLVGDMDNEGLWLLIRRFNKQVYHVKSIPNPVPGGLDLNIADDEEFSPDKLRATIERLYMTVIVQLLAAVKHAARLRSWRERRRTLCFASAYFAAWLLDLLVPMLSVTSMALIIYPPAREILFPPAPLALVDTKSGSLKKPAAGVLGSHDSATGAPEKLRGEAVEQEASNFVSGITSVALSSAAGKHPGDVAEDEGPADSAPDPSAIAVGASEARAVSSGSKPEAGSKHDKTKNPMEVVMWAKMKPILHALADVADTWERFGNALSPTAPFSRNSYRIRLVLAASPLLLMSLFTSSYLFTKGVTFGVGFGFFGNPVITRGLALLERRFPNWQKLLELRNTLLKGVPTNAQLTITLLRIGEANKAPLPPPPRFNEATPDDSVAVTSEDLQATAGEAPLGATESEVDNAVRRDPATVEEADGKEVDASKSSNHGKKGSKILGFFKGTTKGAVKTAMGTDTVKAKAGSGKAKDRLGVLPRHQHLDGPVDFQARHKGQRGRVYISTRATIPAVAFSTHVKSDLDQIEAEHVHAAWSVAVADIVELKKIGGYGWKAKLVVGWSTGKEVADGLEITTSKGERVKITACPLRNELFNRLVAMGGQKWEAW